MTAYPATETIARFVTETGFETVPPAAWDVAKVAFMDCLGVALAGSKEASATLAAQVAREEAAREEASIAGQGFQSSAVLAAFVNGTAAHALDYDHGFASGGQPTAPVIPAAVAVAEALGADGRRLLEAYVAGFEVTTKVSQSLYRVPQDGWHAPGTMGLLGATVAACMLLGLSTEQVRNALGIATSMGSGVESNFGTMTKPLHVGLAAKNGVLAAKLAASGYTANTQAIETELGFYDVYYRVTPGDDTPLDTLGKSYEIVDNGIRIKPYPCGGLAHTAIDAMLALRAEHGLTPEVVEAIHVEATQRTVDRIVFGVPRTGLEGKFSMPYLMGRALVNGRVGLEAFTDDAVQDPEVFAVARTVSLQLGADLKATQAGRPARVTVKLRDGRSVSHQVDTAKGGPEVPMTRDELRGKFFECARQAMSPSAAERLLDHIDRLDTLDDVRPLGTLLRG